ncbi:MULTISPECIES: hypothetical protein [unclassified Microcoleus]|uniref:hypothetical protein n=1 Tax=unclassified Microcoleus TaxID=2642155 RepID=UPI002FD52BDA
MTTITINESSFQVEPFVRYKENRVKGHFSLQSQEFSSLNMAIVKIKSRTLTLDSVLASLPVNEIWGFVVNDSGGTLSTVLTLKRDLPPIEPGKIYELDFLPFKTAQGKGFMLNAFPRNPMNDIEKYALEVADDILHSEIDFCQDKRLNEMRV